MQLNRRVSALERGNRGNLELPIVFRRIVSKVIDGDVTEARMCMATICGTALPRIRPYDGETDDDFARRVCAIKAGGKLTEDMTEDELAEAYVVGDRKLSEAADAA